MAGKQAGNRSITATMTLEKQRSLSPESMEEVREVGIAEFEQAAQCLSEAFAVDEVARYFVDTDDMAQYSEEVKYKLHCDIIRYITAAHCYKGIVTTIGPNFDAVALWYASCRYRPQYAPTQCPLSMSLPVLACPVICSKSKPPTYKEQDASRTEHGRFLDHSSQWPLASLLQTLIGRAEALLQRVHAASSRYQARSDGRARRRLVLSRVPRE